EAGSTIGLILTTLNEAAPSSLESVVVRRIRSILAQSISETEIRSIGISFHVFPDRDGNSWRKNSRFHSDVGVKDRRTKYPAALKRAIDVAGSLAALIVLSPLFAVIAILIKWTSEGPVFFRQERIGQLGHAFKFLKFRSMYLNNDPAIHREYVRNLI